MAEPESTTPEITPDKAAQAGGGRGILHKIKIAVFVGAIIAGELAVAYAYYGAAGRTTPTETAEDPEAGLDDPDSLFEDPASAQAERVEVQLGEFDVTVYQPLAKRTLRVSFTLWGTVTQEDESDLADKLLESQHRFREKVLVTIRGSEITDLTDPLLSLIKRKLLENTNRILGRPLLQEIVISDFVYFEQERQFNRAFLVTLVCVAKDSLFSSDLSPNGDNQYMRAPRIDDRLG
jgi:flagellar FliL protein